ncbi:MAG: O-antigen ligase family protein [Candidatus Sericytochromatia bacterium]|nr:O-antigen ligase family protein [Candidatus Sericytochromatia bacterium]
MLIFWLAYLCFRMAFTQRSASLWVIGALIVTAGLQGTYGVYQWLVGVEPLANWEDPEALNPLTRVYGSLMNPNLLAGYLLSAFPIAAAVTVFSRGIYRAVAAFTACTTLICIFFTYSRGAYLGLLSSLGIFLGMAALLMWPRFKHQRGIVTAMVTALAALCAGVVWKVVSTPALLERLASIFTLRGHSSNSFRLNVWTGVWQMIQDNWLVGVGVGNNAFRKMYSLYMVSGYEALGAYNIFLEVLAELGILGLAAFLFINLLAWKTNWRTFRQGDPPARWMAAGITAALVGTWVMGLFDTVFYRPAIQLQFWLLLALTITWSGNIAPTSGISKNSTN